MNRTNTTKSRLTQGNVMSWVLGATLGLMLGVALLIFANATAAPSAGEEGAAAEVTPAVEMAGSEAATAGESDTMTNESQESAPAVAAMETDPDSMDAQAPEGEEAAEAAADPVDPEPVTVGEGEDDTEALESPAVAAADADPDAGAEVFASSSCAGCHGPDAAGGAVGPSLANAAGWSVEELAVALREGQTPAGQALGAAMPKFSAEQIGDQNVADLHAWLQTLPL